jgi:NAD(P)-dependent dehydrogenase (short-subunit alcohol dehydrogenase family)
MDTLSGRRALVTGGTTGIGRAIAWRLAENGVRVLIFGRHQRELDDALGALKDAGGQVEGMIADQSHPKDMEKVFKKAKELGGLDIVVVNAGISGDALGDMNNEDWRYTVETNLTGYLDVAKRAAEAFAGGKGDIILIGSVSADHRSKGSSVYAATKAGIQGFADSFRKEMGDKNVRVSLVQPGAVGSDMQEMSPADQRKEIEAGRMLKAEDIADLIVFIVTRPQRCTVSSVTIEELVQSD